LKDLAVTDSKSIPCGDNCNITTICEMQLLQSKIMIPAESHEAVRTIFHSISVSDVHQKSGKAELNVGEISPEAVTELIRVSRISSSDIFVDIGSGVGNVIAQVALESTAKASIGIEIRAQLTNVSRRQIEHYSSLYPRLRTIQIHAQDIITSDLKRWQDATVIYCHNTLFQPATQLIIEHLCCSLPQLRTVILQSPFCNRHRMGCTRDFCSIFRQSECELRLSVSFKSKLVPFRAYFKI